MSEPIIEDEFLALVRGFRESAFRLEAQPKYRLSYEGRDFEDFIAGHPRPPDKIDWWRPWLERVRQFVSEDKHVTRVRILAEPPTEYQRWLLWANPWHAAAGEDIGYMPRSRAERIGLPLLHDWWLLDDERVIGMWFTRPGEIDYKRLITDPRRVARYIGWRDLALRNATPAEEIRAA